MVSSESFQQKTNKEEQACFTWGGEEGSLCSPVPHLGPVGTGKAPVMKSEEPLRGMEGQSLTQLPRALRGQLRAEPTLGTRGPFIPAPP